MKNIYLNIKSLAAFCALSVFATDSFGQAYYRSKLSGGSAKYWTQKNDWESSNDGVSWGNSSNYPGQAGNVTKVTIQAGTSVSVVNPHIQSQIGTFEISGDFTITSGIAFNPNINNLSIFQGGVLNIENAYGLTNKNLYVAGTMNVNAPYSHSGSLGNGIEVTATGVINIASGVSMTITNVDLLNNNRITSPTLTGKLVYAGASLNGISGNGTIKNLEIAKTVSGPGTGAVGIDFGAHQRITGLLTLTSGILNTNSSGAFDPFTGDGDGITLKSTDSVTHAMVGPVAPGFVITGDVNVERYYYRPNNVGHPISSGRGWRLMTMPLKSGVLANNSVYENFQNGGKNFGIAGLEIWGPTGNEGANGLKVGPKFSMRTFDLMNNAFVNVTNTKTTSLNTATANTPFLLYFTGPYGSNFITSGSAARTVLRAAGQLITGDQTTVLPATNNPAKKYALIANPYNCPIDFAQIFADATGIVNRFWIIDPKLQAFGAYVSVDGTGGSYVTFPSSSAQNRFIQPGQAFFVEYANTSNPITLVIKESHKNTTAAQTAVMRTNNGDHETMEINLNAIPTGYAPIQVDGAFINTHMNANNAVDYAEDADKFTNWSETIFISNGTKKLGFESRQLFDNGDNVNIGTTGLDVNMTYQLEINPANFNAPGLTATLYDNVNNVTIPVSLTQPTVYTFVGNANSTSASQFSLSFSGGTTLGVRFAGIQAAAKENAVEVNWQVSDETGTVEYEVEKSTDARSFSAISEVKAEGAKNYSIIDAEPANVNYYRVKAIARNGEANYSSIVKVAIGGSTTELNTYPNPAVGSTAQLQISNLERGTYSVSVYNALGQLMTQHQMVHLGGSANQTLDISKLTPGMYEVRLSGSESIIANSKLVKQ